MTETEAEQHGEYLCLTKKGEEQRSRVAIVGLVLSRETPWKRGVPRGLPVKMGEPHLASSLSQIQI